MHDRGQRLCRTGGDNHAISLARATGYRRCLVVRVVHEIGHRRLHDLAHFHWVVGPHLDKCALTTGVQGHMNIDHRKSPGLQQRADYSMTTAHLIAEQGVRLVNLSRSGNTIALANTQRVDGGINFTQGGERGTAIWIALGANDFIFGVSSLEQDRNHYLTVLSRIDRIAKQKISCATPLTKLALYLI